MTKLLMNDDLNRRLVVIDGGFSSAYHKETGIAGYTLVYHSRGFQLAQHEPFTSAEDAINDQVNSREYRQGILCAEFGDAKSDLLNLL